MHNTDHTPSFLKEAEDMFTKIVMDRYREAMEKIEIMKKQLNDREKK